MQITQQHPRMRFAVLLLLPLLSFCSRAAAEKQISETDYDKYVAALPELKPVTDKNVVLQVFYVENPRLAKFDAAQRNRLYRAVEKNVKDVFQITLRIEETGSLPVNKFFGKAKDRFRQEPIGFPAQSYLISWFDPNRVGRIADAIKGIFKNHDLAKIREYLGADTSLDALTAHFMMTLGKIYAEKDLRGKPLLSRGNRDDEAQFSYGHWSSILQGEKSCDFILTNGGIIGADNGMPIYVIARGGVTSAFVENNAHRPYQGVGVFGLYPILADTPFFNEKRGKLTDDEKIEAASWLWVHELGHLLLKKNENYTFADSVHRAPPDLRYFEWAKRVRASRNHHTKEIPNMKKF